MLVFVVLHGYAAHPLDAKSEGNCESTRFFFCFCKVLETNTRTSRTGSERKEKAHASNIINFFACQDVAGERERETREREGKKRNQRVSLSRSSFRSANVLCSSCLRGPSFACVLLPLH
jgi:hypothetical protein